MKLVKILLMLACGVSLGACGPLSLSRNAASNFDASLIPAETARASVGWTVADVRVNVPETLTVSEADSYYPFADIVWRGDAFGDRYAQTRQIMDDGLTRGLAHLAGPRDVFFDITLKRFHSLTPKARYLLGGVHNIIFDLEVRDAATGQRLSSITEIELNLRAYGGKRAVVAAGQGRTPKMRIEEHLTNTMRRQFGGTVGSAIPVAARG